MVWTLFSKHLPATKYTFSRLYYCIVHLPVAKNPDILKLMKNNYYLLTYVSSMKYSLENYASLYYSCKTSQNSLSATQSTEVSQFYGLLVSMSIGLIFLYCNFTGELTRIQAALRIPLIWRAFGLGPNA